MQELLWDTWARILPELKAKVGRAVYDSWLASLRPIALERGVLHFEARNRMAAERVERLYRDLIGDLMSAEFGTAVSITVQPSPESLVPDQLEVGPTRPLVDASNRTAFLVLRTLLEERDLPSSLLFFHGPPGCGKTFLLDWWRTTSRARPMRFDGPSLLNAFQAVIRERRLESFRAELQRDEVLILDEIHRVRGHRRIQRELARLLEARSRLTRPTLIASRWHPREIHDLDPGLETWLLAGFVTRVDWPGPRARLGYLRALEGPPSRNGRAGPVERLAREIQAGYPELRRAWAVERHARAHQRDQYFRLIEPRAVFERLRDRVCEHFEVDSDELVSKSQKRRASHARKVLAWLCVQEGLNQAEIGRYLQRTRAAISYAIKSLVKEMGEDTELRLRVEGLL